MSQQDPTFLVAESRDGKPALSGKRRVVDGIDDALDTATEIGGTAYALEPIEENAFPPVSVSRHVSMLPDDPLTANAAQSSHFERTARQHGMAFPEAWPDEEEAA